MTICANCKHFLNKGSFKEYCSHPDVEHRLTTNYVTGRQYYINGIGMEVESKHPFALNINVNGKCELYLKKEEEPRLKGYLARKVNGSNDSPD